MGAASLAVIASPSEEHEFTICRFFGGVNLAQSLVFCAEFCESSLFLVCPLSFGHYIVCPSSIHGFYLALWFF